MTRRTAATIRLGTVLSILALALGACENGSPSPGEGCVASGGVCNASAICSESLPYPCPGNATCCIPVSSSGSSGGMPHDADGGSGG